MTFIASLALLTASLHPQATVPVPDTGAERPTLSLDQRMVLRCSAAFAIAAHGQDRGDATMRAWPDLRERGREFFVRSSARLMDEAGLDRAAITALMQDEARSLREEGTLPAVMPVCLTLLPPQ